jgi:hypothetical protein
MKVSHLCSRRAGDEGSKRDSTTSKKASRSGSMRSKRASSPSLRRVKAGTASVLKSVKKGDVQRSVGGVGDASKVEAGASRPRRRSSVSRATPTKDDGSTSRRTPVSSHGRRSSASYRSGSRAGSLGKRNSPAPLQTPSPASRLRGGIPRYTATSPRPQHVQRDSYASVARNGSVRKKAPSTATAAVVRCWCCFPALFLLLLSRFG